MKILPVYLVAAVTLIGLLNACGPSEEELRQQREQARQDSLERVRQLQLQQQRLDSIAQARAEAAARRAEQEAQEAAAQEAAEQFQFSSNGPLAVQVEAWRSRQKAQEQISKWRERGFPNAYVVKHGSENTGNVWFRIRLGRISNMNMADSARSRLQNRYGERVWIANVEPEDIAPADSASY